MIELVIELVELHLLDGRAVNLNPQTIVSVSEPKEKGVINEKARCVLTLLDGKHIVVVENCVQVRQRLGK